jgi:hypothetical protein
MYIMLDSMDGTMSVYTGLYPKLDLWNTNKLQSQFHELGKQILHTRVTLHLSHPIPWEKGGSTHSPQMKQFALQTQYTLLLYHCSQKTRCITSHFPLPEITQFFKSSTAWGPEKSCFGIISTLPPCLEQVLCPHPSSVSVLGQFP